MDTLIDIDSIIFEDNFSIDLIETNENNSESIPLSSWDLQLKQ